MRQVICTKYIGPSNYRSARICAMSAGVRLYYPYDHALNVEQNHERAAKRYALNRGWPGQLHGGGGLPDGSYAFVFVGTAPESSDEQ